MSGSHLDQLLSKSKYFFFSKISSITNVRRDLFILLLELPIPKKQILETDYKEWKTKGGSWVPSGNFKRMENWIMNTFNSNTKLKRRESERKKTRWQDNTGVLLKIVTSLTAQRTLSTNT